MYSSCQPPSKSLCASRATCPCIHLLKAMWTIFQAFVHLWTWISTRLFVKKNKQPADLEKVAGSGEDLQMPATRVRNQYEQRTMRTFRNDSSSLYPREMAMSQRNTAHSSRQYYGLRRGTVEAIENNPYYCVASLDLPRPKRAKQPRKHSAKYRLRQGEYVDKWDCELSELYGKRSPPQPCTPSPLLSGFSPLEETWPTPLSTVSTSRISQSPFLASLESPQFLTQFTDLRQAIMTDFKPVGYSPNALSAVTDTFWDAPSAMRPAKPSLVFGVDGSAPLIWSLPSFPTHECAGGG